MCQRNKKLKNEKKAMIMEGKITLRNLSKIGLEQTEEL